jgi:hypothetical protein
MAKEFRWLFWVFASIFVSGAALAAFSESDTQNPRQGADHVACADEN